MLTVIIRTLILYALVFATMRLTGKRQIGQLQPYEVTVAIMISALAAIPMEDVSIPLTNSIIPILLLLSGQVLVSMLSMKVNKVRAFLCGKPSILVENGKLVEQELKKSRVNLNDLLEQLRLAGFHNIADVEFAIMESNGEFSVIPKSQKRPVTPEDLGVSTKYEGITQTLIIDGRVDHDNLCRTGLTEEWLARELSKFGIHNVKDVLLASLDTSGKLYFQVKGKTNQKSNCGEST
ncbi:MAG: DUF421 domain-containing protein [Firmicutes bacterium]|nr:DUF421 domain-containing protein [Bacillota bacterium]